MSGTPAASARSIAALLAQLDDELVGEREVHAIDRLGAELVHHHREAPLEIADRLGASVRGPWTTSSPN